MYDEPSILRSFDPGDPPVDFDDVHEAWLEDMGVPCCDKCDRHHTPDRNCVGLEAQEAEE